jgi:hypothetical protein
VIDTTEKIDGGFNAKLRQLLATMPAATKTKIGTGRVQYTYKTEKGKQVLYANFKEVWNSVAGWIPLP